LSILYALVTLLADLALVGCRRGRARDIEPLSASTRAEAALARLVAGGLSDEDIGAGRGRTPEQVARDIAAPCRRVGVSPGPRYGHVYSQTYSQARGFRSPKVDGSRRSSERLNWKETAIRPRADPTDQALIGGVGALLGARGAPFPRAVERSGHDVKH
jgi:hypothetical protein